jgi:hypothetical protein
MKDRQTPEEKAEAVDRLKARFREVVLDNDYGILRVSRRRFAVVKRVVNLTGDGGYLTYRPVEGYERVTEQEAFAKLRSIKSEKEEIGIYCIRHDQEV